jgi:hypothetical protein
MLPRQMGPTGKKKRPQRKGASRSESGALAADECTQLFQKFHWHKGSNQSPDLNLNWEPNRAAGLVLPGSMEVGMQARRHVEQDHLLDERLVQEAARLKEAAKGTRPGAKRQEMLRKARQAEIAASIASWLSSPGFLPPE